MQHALISTSEPLFVCWFFLAPFLGILFFDVHRSFPSPVLYVNQYMSIRPTSMTNTCTQKYDNHKFKRAQFYPNPQIESIDA